MLFIMNKIKFRLHKLNYKKKKNEAILDHCDRRTTLINSENQIVFHDLPLTPTGPVQSNSRGTFLIVTNLATGGLKSPPTQKLAMVLRVGR